MNANPISGLKLFYCYAREDSHLRAELDLHLTSLKRRYHITTWHDDEISPGMEWKKEIEAQLNAAHIILLLISPNFIASDYCYNIEMKRALERYESNEACVIPILLRPVHWEKAPFSGLQLLPRNAKPLTSWSNHDEAFSSIAADIYSAVKERVELFKKKTKDWNKQGQTLQRMKRYEEALAAYEQAIFWEENMSDKAIYYDNKGDTLRDMKRYEEALAAYEEAIRIDPNYAAARNNKGLVLRDLKLYEEALTVYEEAIRIDPNYVWAYNNKGLVLQDLKRYEEALAAYKEAIRIDPNYVWAYHGKGNALREMKRYGEALAAYEEAIRIDPNYVWAYHGKGNTLRDMKRYEEALAAYEEATRIDPKFATGYNGKGNTLRDMKRYEEALAAFDEAIRLS
jgi:tetratricopeptide (TPR) repeat protein